MENQTLRRYLKEQLNDRADRLATGLPVSDPLMLAAQYRYEVGVIHGLAMVDEWVKEQEAKNLQQEINSDDA